MTMMFKLDLIELKYMYLGSKDFVFYQKTWLQDWRD